MRGNQKRDVEGPVTGDPGMVYVKVFERRVTRHLSAILLLTKQHFFFFEHTNLH